MSKDAGERANDDGAKAARFFLVHAAIFILVPLVMAGLAVWWQFG